MAHSNEEVVRAFTNSNRSEMQGGNISFCNDILYSYNMPIAVRTNLGVVKTSEGGNTNTAQRHISLVNARFEINLYEAKKNLYLSEMEIYDYYAPLSGDYMGYIISDDKDKFLVIENKLLNIWLKLAGEDLELGLEQLLKKHFYKDYDEIVFADEKVFLINMKNSQEFSPDPKKVFKSYVFKTEKGMASFKNVYFEGDKIFSDWYVGSYSKLGWFEVILK